MQSAGGKRKRGCESCRERHLKCDRRQPCAHCVRKGTQCVRDHKIRFRYVSNPSLGKAQYKFRRNQRWCRVSTRKFQFVDETSAVAASIEDDSEEEGGGGSVDLDIQQADALAGPASRLPSGRGEAILDESTVAARSDEELASPAYPPIALGLVPPITGFQSLVAESHGGSGSQDMAAEPTTAAQLPASTPGLGSMALQRPRLPLKSRHEAHLVRHFIEKLAPAFDVCDPDNNFGTIVPRNAFNCPSLLGAVLLASATHIRLGAAAEEGLWPTQSSADMALEDSSALQECFSQLRLSPDEYGVSVLDGNLFATAVLLRYVEVADALSLSPKQSLASPLLHGTFPLGLRDILTCQAPLLAPNGLHQAAFWAGLRLEIHFAATLQKPIDVHLEYCSLDRSLDQASDAVWARRMMLHVAEAVQYCFGGDKSLSTYNRLVQYSSSWMDAKPQSFAPIFPERWLPGSGSDLGIERDGDDPAGFPEIFLLGGAAVAGRQYYHIGKILLTAHDPKVPRLGKGQKLATQIANDEIKNDVNVICGLAESVGQVNPAHIAACVAISLAGDRFTTAAEQGTLVNIADKTLLAYGWPSPLFT